MKYALFSNFTNNTVLQGSIIKTLLKKSQEECEVECVNEFACKSINSENAGQNTCELNSESASDPSDNVTLTAKSGWTFKSTNYSDPLVRMIFQN